MHPVDGEFTITLLESDAAPAAPPFRDAARIYATKTGGLAIIYDDGTVEAVGGVLQFRFTGNGAAGRVLQTLSTPAKKFEWRTFNQTVAASDGHKFATEEKTSYWKGGILGGSTTDGTVPGIAFTGNDLVVDDDGAINKNGVVYDCMVTF